MMRAGQAMGHGQFCLDFGVDLLSDLQGGAKTGPSYLIANILKTP